MCGICGICTQADIAPARSLLERMAGVLGHRGPDDDGYYVNRGIGFGHRRLSIVDPAHGHQPMSNEEGTVQVICNGEIYNHLELREQLQKRGHHLKTGCDTEVIAHVYEDYGESFVERLSGKFAIALWDGRKQRLVLARDRIGIKPLYYYLGADRLLFGSEIKAILQDPGVERQVDFEALHSYLTFRFVPAPKTMFKGIQKLIPGHILIYEGGKSNCHKYWDLKPAEIVSDSAEDCARGLHDLLRGAVKSRLMSDVPVGALLSGGVDSSAIVAFMAELSSEPVKTFSIGFDSGERFNELRYARIVADYFSTDHHEMVIGVHDYVEALPKCIWHLDEPVADSASVPLYLICRLASRSVKVLLTGEGSDELFGGYPRHWGDKLARYYQQLPPFLTNSVVPGLAARLPRSRTLKKAIRCMAIRDNASRFSGWHDVFPSEIREDLYTSGLKDLTSQFDPTRQLRAYLADLEAADPLSMLLYADLKMWLPDDLLMKKDKMAMAASIEGRVPFLDHLVVERAWSIPAHLKVKGFKGKYIFKQAVRGMLPPEIMTRKKMGFPTPIDGWFRNELKGYVSELLLDSRSVKRGYFERTGVERLLRLHREGREDFSPQIFALICLELWHQAYLD